MPEVLLQGQRILAVVGQPHAVSLEFPEARDRALLVALHHGREADYVRSEDRGETAGGHPNSPAFRQPSIRVFIILRALLAKLNELLPKMA